MLFQFSCNREETFLRRTCSRFTYFCFSASLHVKSTSLFIRGRRSTVQSYSNTFFKNLIRNQPILKMLTALLSKLARLNKVRGYKGPHLIIIFTRKKSCPHFRVRKKTKKFSIILGCRLSIRQWLWYLCLVYGTQINRSGYGSAIRYTID